MRLYLSSYRVGRHGQRLVELTRGGRRTALIRNAVGHLPPRPASLARDLADLEGLGLAVQELDLRDPADVQRLADFEVLFVRGGNTFVLRRVLADSGADRIILELLRQDRLVYAGFSAGACVLAPDLRPLEMVDDPQAVAEPIWTGLGLLDRPFVPHVQTPEHPESADCDRLAAHLSAQGTPHYALRDGEILLRDGERWEWLR